MIGDQNFLFIQNNNEINLPFFLIKSLDSPDESVQKAVIVIHGANRMRMIIIILFIITHLIWIFLPRQLLLPLNS